MTSPKLFLYRLKNRIKAAASQPNTPHAAKPAAKPAPAAAAKPLPTGGAPLGTTDTSDYITLNLAGLGGEDAIKLVSQKASSFDELSNETLGAAAKHYQSFGLHREALNCQRILMERDPKNATQHSYARALFASGDAKAALAQLETLNQDIFTERGRQLFDQDRLSYLRSVGRNEDAYAMLSQSAADHEDPDLNIEVKLAEIERQMCRTEDAYERLKKHAARFGKSPVYLQHLSAALGEMNRNSEAMLIAGILCADPKPLTPQVTRYIDLLWQEGAIRQLCSFLERIVRLRMMHPTILKSLREKAHADDRIATMLMQFETNVRDTYATAKPEQMVGFAERFYALELFDDAKKAASRYIATFKQSPTAYYIRGAAAFYLEDYETAERDLLRCVDLNPAYFQAYGILLNVLPRRIDGVQKLAQLLKIRNNAHWKYTAYGADGRRGLLDIEGSQLAFMQGDFMAGQKLRQERPVCRYLQDHFPETYDCFETPDFPAEKKDTLLVITEDGVGDEVRWSQYFPQLTDHYKSVEVTCDPRLLSIFERSFPDVTFYPFKRRLMERAEDREVNPSTGVPYFPLARLIDDTLYNRLGEYSELRMTADMVRGAWAKQPGGQPLPDGPADVPHLVPDAARVTQWKKNLEKTGKGKLKVGILWQSSFVTPRRKKHYLELENLSAMLSVKGVQYYSLQSEHTPEDLALCRKLGIEILEDIDLQDDFEEVAALASALDLVVGVNSFMGEMAAAVGTPCWMLGAYNNLVRFRLGESDGEVDRLSPNVTIVRVDRETGFVGADAGTQRKVAATTKERLMQVVKSKNKR